MTHASGRSTQRHEHRTETVAAPHGPLAATGTCWSEGGRDGRLPDIPGTWTADGDGVVPTIAGTDEPTAGGRAFRGIAPHALADHSACPFPPPGNTRDLAIPAGERTLR